jgi:hydroxymethylpyrimidine/phosphomethylpyrimidine kinase
MQNPRLATRTLHGFGASYARMRDAAKAAHLENAMDVVEAVSTAKNTFSPAFPG